MIGGEAMKIRHVLTGALTALAISASLAATPALARGALILEQDVCTLKIGPDFMYFSGYQPAAVARKRFCEDVPATGETIFAMDFAQEEMREMKTDVRIVRDVGEENELAQLDAVTVAYLPPQIYPKGTVSLTHSFAEPGNYAGIVTVDGPHGQHWVARFPFAVGRHYPYRLPYYLLTAAAVLALVVYFWGRDEKGRPSLTKS
jgi:hypothetical protein